MDVHASLESAPLLDVQQSSKEITNSNSANLLSLCLIDEGAANFIYDITAAANSQVEQPSHMGKPEWDTDRKHPDFFQFESHQSDRSLAGKLLRIGKDSPLCPSGKDSYKFFNTFIVNSFEPNEYIDVEPIRLGALAIQAMNRHIAMLDKRGARPERRRGTQISVDQAVGLLVDDMRSVDTSKSFTIEFKPKWLAQSPTAPPNAVRCRNCALRAYRASQSPQISKTTSFCPLALLTRDERITERAIQSLVNDSPTVRFDLEVTLKAIEDLTEFFTSGRGYRLLARLRNLQIRHASQALDLTKVENPTDTLRLKQELSRAMTLRDCSLYVRYYYGDAKQTEARLADLDPKPLTKYDDWIKLEHALISGGWYTQDSITMPESRCFLSATLEHG